MFGGEGARRLSGVALPATPPCRRCAPALPRPRDATTGSSKRRVLPRRGGALARDAHVPGPCFAASHTRMARPLSFRPGPGRLRVTGLSEARGFVIYCKMMCFGPGPPGLAPGSASGRRWWPSGAMPRPASVCTRTRCLVPLVPVQRVRPPRARHVPRDCTELCDVFKQTFTFTWLHSRVRNHCVCVFCHTLPTRSADVFVSLCVCVCVCE